MIASVTKSVCLRQAFFVMLAAALATSRPALAQHDSETPAAMKASGLDRTLVLRLTRGPDEASDSDAKRACIAGHPPISCELLTVELKNVGAKAVLLRHSSCREGISFDLTMADGSWEQFPIGTGTEGIIVCNRNVLVLRRLLPGQSYVRHLRLADPSLGLNTTAPPSDSDGAIHVRGKGYPLLMGHQPLTIRARWQIDACIASDAIKSESDLNPFAAGSLCAAGTEPQSTVFTSEALQLR